MRYRKLTKDRIVNNVFVKGGDYVFGRGRADFWVDVPEAPAQHVMTRLRLETGDWFLDLREGTPWKTQVLGKYTSSTRDPVIRYRVLNTTGVREIISFSSNLNRETRAYTVNILLDTVYGPLRVQGPV